MENRIDINSLQPNTYKAMFGLEKYSGPNDFEAQVDRSFENLVAALNAAGGRVDDVVKITLLIKDHDQHITPRYTQEEIQNGMVKLAHR